MVDSKTMCSNRYWKIFIMFCFSSMIMLCEQKKIKLGPSDVSTWVPGTWGDWSSWSSCSKDCDRGVSAQSRECISGTTRWNIQGRSKRSRNTKSPFMSRCLGTYKRFVICNIKPCPKQEDWRKSQCSTFNNKSFRGHRYRWEPYLKDGEDCQLNCRPIGHQFFVTLAKVIDDGTECGVNGSKVCIAGQCKNIGCDGVVGSENKLDQCGVCGGDNSTCRIVSGLYTRPTLPVGYNLIARIPPSACNVNITELKRSGNYLALRSSNGSYIINGNWAINWSGDYDAVGTTFSYKRHDSHNNQFGESILAKGPITQGMDLLMIYRQPNSGIKYEYTLPLQDALGKIPKVKTIERPRHLQLAFRDGPQISHHWNYQPVLSDGRGYQPESNNSLTTLDNKINSFPLDNHISSKQTPWSTNMVERTHRRFDVYRWKLAGLSECTQSCGGGTQRTVVSCIKQHTSTVVPDIHCDPRQRPEIQIVRCNTHPCPAIWVPGEWEPCSVTCGEGSQHRKLLCKQEVSPTLNINVAEGACQGQERLQTDRKCIIKPCANWEVGQWSKCSAECGKGMRKREVKCVIDDGSVTSVTECRERKPPTDEMCDMGPCVNTWFFSEWGKTCSAECGRGHLTRKVICLHGSGKAKAEGTCDSSKRPESQKNCNNEKGCGGKWFVGSWSQCSVTCGNGTQNRDILCMTLEYGVWRLAPDVACRRLVKPITEQICQNSPCTDEWYRGQWTECSKPCNTGVQIREVTCINNDLQVSSGCSEKNKPATRQACNTVECPEGKQDSGCVDKFRNCNLVVQARLCSYNYYRNICCDSCFSYK